MKILKIVEFEIAKSLFPYNGDPHLRKARSDSHQFYPSCSLGSLQVFMHVTFIELRAFSSTNNFFGWFVEFSKKKKKGLNKK